MELNLDDDPESDDANGFVNNIRREALTRVLRDLVKRPPPGKKQESGRGPRPVRLNVLDHRNHSAILVSARRGDGKTTFLTHLLGEIEKGADAYSKYLDESERSEAARLYSLGLIDPTLIERKQNIVVMILDRIRQAVEHKFRQYPNEEGVHRDLRGMLRILLAV